MTYDSEYYERWRKKNWEKRKEYYRSRLVCDVCNAKISRGTKYSHVRTKKHLAIMPK